MNITNRLAKHAAALKYDDLPKSVIEVQKKSIADSIACMIAATGVDNDIHAVYDTASKLGGPGKCTMLSNGFKTTPMMAALSNGALSHFLDFEDSHELALVHPNEVSMPVMIALAEYDGNKSGKDFLTALVLASDICCRLDFGVSEDVLKYGWNMPPIHGGMSAVIGACNFLGLDEEKILDAIALNMCQVTSSGEAAFSAESVVRSIRDGFAAQASVLSALTAAKGIVTRFDDAFGGKNGYFRAYARDKYTPENVLEGLGDIFQSEFISFKPWPCCRATHTSIEGVQNIINVHNLRAEDVEEIHLVLHEIGKMVLEPREIKYNPQTAAMAKFSIPFILGTLLKYGDVNLQSFTQERLCDSEIIKIGKKVTYEIDNELTKEQNKVTGITLKTKDQTFNATVNYPLGCRENPMSEQQMLNKFRSCMDFGKKSYSDKQIDSIFDMINHIEELDNVCTLFELL